MIALLLQTMTRRLPIQSACAFTCFFLVSTVGCGLGGESIQDQMMARAKAKAARNKLEKEAEKEIAKPPKENAPAANAAKPKKDTPDSSKPPIRDEPEPPTDSLAQTVEPIIQEPPPAMYMDNAGRLLAFEREEGGFGIFDVSEKRILQVIETSDSNYKRYALHPGGQYLFAANEQGRVKVVSLESSNQLDVFEQRRRRQAKGQDDQYAHDSAVTAISPVGYSGGYVTASSKGEVKIWDAPSLQRSIGQVAGGILSLEDYADGKFLFAASNLDGKGRVVFWRSPNDNTGNEEPTKYVELDGTATTMTQSVKGGGLTVGDSTGTAHVWSTQDGNVKKSVLKHSDSPVTAAAFLNDASRLVLGDQNGDVRQYDLPIASPRSIDLPSPESRLLAIDSSGSKCLVSVSPNDLSVIRLADGQTTGRLKLSPNSEITSSLFLTGEGQDAIALGTASGKIQFHDVLSGKAFASMRVGQAKVEVKRLQNTQSLAYWTDDGQLGKLKLPTATIPFASPGAGSLQIAADSRKDLSLVVSHESNIAQVYELKSGRIVGSTSLADVEGSVTATYIHNGIALLGTDRGRLWIWQSNLPHARPRPLSVESHGSSTLAIQLLNEQEVFTCDDTGTVRSYDLALAKAGPVKSTTKFQFEDDFDHVTIGQNIGFAARELLVIFDQNGSEKTRLPAAEDPILAVASSATSELFAIALSSGKIQLVHDGGRRDLEKSELEAPFTDIAWAADGKTLIATGGTNLAQFDASTGSVISEQTHSSEIKHFSVCNDGKLCFLDQSGSIQRCRLPQLTWNNSDPVRILSVAEDTTETHWYASTETGQIWKIGSEDGSVLETNQVSDTPLGPISSTSNGKLLVFNPSARAILDCTDPSKPQELFGSLPITSALRISPDTTQIAFVSERKKLMVCPTQSNSSKPSSLDEDIDIQDITFLNSSVLAVVPKGKATLQLLPLNGRGERVDGGFKTAKSICEIPGQNAVALADGTDTIHLMQLGSSEAKQLTVEGLAFNAVQVNQSGDLLVAVGEQPSRLGAGDAIAVWDLQTPTAPPKTLDLASKATCLAWMHDQRSIAIGISSGSIHWFDYSTGTVTERMELPSAPNSIKRNSEPGRLWIGVSSNETESRVISIRRRLRSTFQSDSAPITDAKVINNRYLITSTAGKLRLHELKDGIVNPDASLTLVGDFDKIGTIEVHADGGIIAAAINGDKPKIVVWKLPSLLPWGQSFKPSTSIPLKQAADAIHFVTDAQLLAGDRTGNISLWDITSVKNLYSFVGHGTAISKIAITSDGTQFISCSGDRNVRRWSLPDTSNLPENASLTTAKAISETELSLVQEPADKSTSVVNEEEEVFSEVRAALLTTSGVESEAAVFELFNDSKSDTSSVAERYETMRKLEQASATTNHSQAIAQLVEARRDFHSNRRRLTSLQRVAGTRTFSDNQPNLLFNATTDFDFRQGSRTVEPEITQGRFVYAAMAANRDSGRLFVWDFGVSGVKTHAWTKLRQKVNDLFALPDGRGVLSFPDMELFSQDGTSRGIAQAHQYAVSTAHSCYESQHLFAAANRGIHGQENSMLQIYRADQLMNQSAQSMASLSGYESEITALAFSNVHRALVFSVRERTGYRVLLADPFTLDVRSVTLIDQGKFQSPWLFPLKEEEESTTQSKGPSGPTNLAFSPDDRLLVMHSQAEGRTGRSTAEKYTYSVYRIDWPESGLPTAEDVRLSIGPVEKDGPYFDMKAERPLFFVSKTLSPEKAKQSGLQSAPSSNIAFQHGNHIHVVNAIAGSLVRKLPIMTSAGIPMYSISPDGRWMITGDDRGAARILDLSNGKSTNLTQDNRPAHSGPIVGVAISPTNPHLGYPEYAVTVGEENRIKVWDILGRITEDN
ncbi:WD40 repeat domain-containing protein [Rhodopirellula bahusiensis]|uniref:WD40 repeat domain-containing protein n=2 Tax=Pseudomonadati TaxID=3379134 RepID=UPI003262E72B